MPRLILQFEERTLKEFAVGPDVTIGRLPDNALIIDNPAVSGHHARVFLEGEEYVVEDLRSRNGTYVNEQHVTRHTLHHGDVLLVGKHKLIFDEADGAEAAAPQRVLSTLGETAYLDTKKHRALLARLREDRAREHAQAKAKASDAATAMVPENGNGRLGVLHVLDGESAQPEYRLEARTSFIGKSEAAVVRLRGWFGPKAAAAIVRNDHGYSVTTLSGKTLVNGERLDGRHDLKDGDVLEVRGLRLEFRFADRTAPGIEAGSDAASLPANGGEAGAVR